MHLVSSLIKRKTDGGTQMRCDSTGGEAAWLVLTETVPCLGSTLMLFYLGGRGTHHSRCCRIQTWGLPIMGFLCFHHSRFCALVDTLFLVEVVARSVPGGGW